MSDMLVTHLNVVHRLRAGYFHQTAIDKRPLEGAASIEAAGVVGDRQVDSSHGGLDRAVYAYANEDAEWWAERLGRDIPAGLFGENLTTAGIDVNGALIGERWRIGAALLEVTMPRTPCQNLSMRIGIERFHLQFAGSGRVGAMLRVIGAGSVCSGDAIEIEERPRHGVTVADFAGRPSADAMVRLLDSGISLARPVSAKARRIVQRARNPAAAP